jgi:hypothetical protein
VREEQGWVLSSRPLAVREDRGTVVVERLRQSVSPTGEMEEELHAVELDELAPDVLEAEAVKAGLRSAGRRQVPETRAYVGSTVVLLRGR